MTQNVVVFAGDGDDSVKTGAGDDIIIGGDGDDLMHGNDGRDILIGGRGADRLVGNRDSDILVAGFSQHDSDLVALSLMMTCNRTPHRMTVVGMRGPANELPLGDAKAAELAACIVKAPGKCSSMSCCNPGASTECIPDDVNVRFERVSFR